MKSSNFFDICFILYEEKMLTDKATINFEIGDGRKAP